MQKKSKLILPHQFQSWARSKILLFDLKQNHNIENCVQIMSKINKEFKWNCKTLLNCIQDKDELIKILNHIAQEALKIQSIFPEGIYISQQLQSLDMSYTVLTKAQAVCLISNMFLGTVLKQPDQQKLPIYCNFQYLSRHKNEILKTILNYFKIVLNRQGSKEYQQQNIIYFRLAQNTKIQEWIKSQQPLSQVILNQKGFIEDQKLDIQIDFANKSIGGFFLTETYTQQDIIFINNPQLMPALLFHRYMSDFQSILMVGAQRYFKYSGYLQTYRFEGAIKDDRQIISLRVGDKLFRVRDSWISAIDAIPYFQNSQFGRINLLRQLNKAFTGFQILKIDQGLKAISTGNWGSGAFNGNLQYKFLIQWLAASRANRKLKYYTFTNPKAKNINKIVNKFKNCKIGQLVNKLLKLSLTFQEHRKVFDILVKT